MCWRMYEIFLKGVSLLASRCYFATLRVTGPLAVSVCTM